MIERICVGSYSDYQIATFTICNDLVEISHFGGSRDSSGNKLTTIEAQFVQSFTNLESALAEINLTLKHLMKVNVILKHIQDFQVMHKAWCRVFPDGHYPARTTITSDFIDEACLVQIDGTAARTAMV